MNAIKKMCMAIVLCSAALFQVDVCAKQSGAVSSMPTKALVDAEAEEVINAEAAKIKEMTREAQDIIDAADEVIRMTEDEERRGEISRAKSAVIIGEQKYIIKQARERLARAIKNAGDKVEEAEAQAGYSLSGLVSGIKSWYYGPEERRSVAQAALAELQKEFENAQEEYTIKMQAADPVAAQQARDEWNTIKQEFEDAINEQQKRMTGGMSTGFWTAVLGATAVVGGAIAYKYLGGEKAKLWEMASKPQVDQAWLDEAMAQQEALQLRRILTNPPKKITRLPEEEESMRIIAVQKPGEKRDLLHIYNNYNQAKTRAKKATYELEDAQQALYANEAEIELLKLDGAAGRNAREIESLKEKQPNLKRAINRAKITQTSAQKAFEAADKLRFEEKKSVMSAVPEEKTSIDFDSVEKNYNQTHDQFGEALYNLKKAREALQESEDIIKAKKAEVKRLKLEDQKVYARQIKEIEKEIKNLENNQPKLKKAVTRAKIKEKSSRSAYYSAEREFVKAKEHSGKGE